MDETSKRTVLASGLEDDTRGASSGLNMKLKTETDVDGLRGVVGEVLPSLERLASLFGRIVKRICERNRVNSYMRDGVELGDDAKACTCAGCSPEKVRVLSAACRPDGTVSGDNLETCHLVRK